MSRLVFYRQVRVDGGVRTAIEIDGYTAFGRFEEGDPDVDPTLLWFVDLRCEGDDLPVEAEPARQWLLTHGASIKEGFRRCASENRAGTDPDIYPLIWEGFLNVPEGVQMKVVFSAMRRSDGIRMAEILSDVAAHWEEYVRAVRSAETAAY